MTERGSRPDATPRPSVAPPFVPVAVDPDTVQFRAGPWAGQAYTLRDQDADGKIADLVRLLDGRRTRAEILDAFGPTDRPEVASILDDLAENGLVVEDTATGADGLAGGVVSPDPSVTATHAETVSASTVLVVNVGRIGRYVVDDLVAAGADTVALFEPDGTDDGADVDGWSGVVDRVERDVDLGAGIADADVVVYTTGSPRPELAREVNEATFEAGVPWISGRLCGLDGFVGPAVIPGRTSCYECFRARWLGNVDDVTAYRRFEQAARVERANRRTDPALSRVVAGYVSIDLQHLLREGIGFTAGSILHFDFFDLTVESNSVLKLPRCRVCGRSRRSTMDRQRHVSLDRLLDLEDES